MFLLLGFSFVLSNSPVSIFVGLKDDLLAAQVDARSSKRTMINDLSTSWELEPADDSREAARGDALVDQL